MTDALFRDIIARDPHFADLLRDMGRQHNQRLADDARADPVRFKLTKVFEDGTSYRYWDATDGRGRKVRFCWSCHRNVAGYFLGWREVVAKDGSGKRDGWIANRRKATLADRAKQKAAKLNAARTKGPAK